MTTEAATEPLLHVVLYQPDIPQNTGNIGRTCVAVGAKLWLIRPLGFRLDEKHLRRAGMEAICVIARIKLAALLGLRSNCSCM